MAHGHESADKHNSQSEWIGRKTKEALGVAGLNMYLGTAFLMAAGIAFPPYVIGALGFMGAGSYAIGARNKGGGKHH